MSQAPKHSLTADLAELELLLDGDIDEPLLYDRIPMEPSECLGVFDAIPVKSSGSLIVSTNSTQTHTTRNYSNSIICNWLVRNRALQKNNNNNKNYHIRIWGNDINLHPLRNFHVNILNIKHDSNGWVLLMIRKISSQYHTIKHNITQNNW